MPLLLRFAVILSLSILSTLAQSEVGSASLTGAVLDPQGSSVAGAKVTVTSAQTGLVRTMETTESGLFNFVRLPVGTYDLSVEFQGFKTFKREKMQLGIGSVVAIDARMEVGSVSDSVTVTTETPIIETTRSQTSTVVNERAIRDLPINGRNFLDFTVLTPGVVRDPRGGDLAFGGMRGTTNSLLVDGGDSNNLFFGQSSGRAGVRNPYAFSEDSVQEFQVNTSGYSAEVGRAAGGVINVITKSGTNDFHGGGFWFFRDRALNANTWANNRNGIRKQPYHFNQFGGNVGGPIARNKLFFFFNYDGQRNKTPIALFYPIPIPADAASQQAAQELSRFQTPYTQGLNNDVYVGKVDWNVSSTQTLSVRYNRNGFVGQNFENGGAQSAAEHTGNSEVHTDNVAATYTKVFGSSVVYDGRFIYLKDDEPGQANSDMPEAQIQQAGRAMITIGRNNFSPRYTNTKRYQTIQSVAWNKGRHAFKFGGDLNLERVDNFFPGNFSGSYTFISLADWTLKRPTTYTQGFAGAGTNGPLTRPNINELAFFAQDSWRVSDRLTLNLGARYDYFDYAAGPVKNPDPGLAAANLDTSRIQNLRKTFAGRFGVAYKLDRAGNWVLRGGAGNFYARVPAILTGTSHSQNGVQVQTYTLRSTIPLQAGLIPTYPNILSAPPALARTPDIYVVEGKFHQPTSYQWSLNLETKLARDLAITSGYLGVRGLHLSRSRDINLFPTERIDSCVVATANLTCASAGAIPVSFFRHPSARPNTNFGRISLFESGADSIYHAFFIQATKRYAQNFQVLASYTFSRVIDTAPDATSVVVGGGDDAKVTQDTLNPNIDRAPGDANVKNRLVLSGVWDLAYFNGVTNPFAKYLVQGWQLSVIAQAQSGRPYSATANTDIGNDGNTRNDRAPGFGRNTFYQFGFGSWDVRVTKDIPIVRDRVLMRIIGEAFNIGNKPNFTSINQTPWNYTAAANVFTPAANFGLPTNTADPRIIQLAARITF